MTTHYVDYDARIIGPRHQQALCGIYVDPKREHTHAPTCDGCRAALREREDADADDITHLAPRTR